MIHKDLQYDKKQISSKGKYINWQFMIRKIFGPLNIVVTKYLPSNNHTEINLEINQVELS